MNRFCLIILVGWLAFSGIAHYAQAKTVYFSFSGAGISGKGQVNVMENQNGTLTAVSGFVTVGYRQNGKKADGLVYSLIPNKNSPSTYFASPLGLFVYDDTLYYPRTPYLNNWGLLFADPAGTTELNIWCNEPGSSCSASFGKEGNYIDDEDVKLIFSSDTR